MEERRRSRKEGQETGVGGSTSYVIESTYECGSRFRKKAYEEPVSWGEGWGPCKPSPGSATAPERLSATAFLGEAGRLKNTAASLSKRPADDSPSFVLN